MKKITRRKFIYSSALLPAAVNLAGNTDFLTTDKTPAKFISIATWKFGRTAVEKAVDVMLQGANSLDAVVEGAKLIEADPTNRTVGLGGIPDSDGEVTLDAAVMDWNGNAGGVAYLKNILHPISVARLVMEKTNHVLLAGEGALKFALAHGFKEENLLTPKARDWWERHRNNDNRKIEENHDTLGILAIDGKGNLSAGVTTSGLALKLPGRVGDSPIIGAGLFADNNVGGAVATGTGELSMKTLGCFLIVEKMREGYSPEEACNLAVRRAEKYNTGPMNSICYLAINKAGEIGAYSTLPRFRYAIGTPDGTEVRNSDYLKERKSKNK